MPTALQLPADAHDTELRPTPGFVAVAAYFTAVPLLLAQVPFFKRVIAQGGWVRYAVLAMLLLFMASLPIKMVLRWTMNLKYVIAIPEYFFNI